MRDTMRLEFMTDDQIKDYLRTTKPNGLDAVASYVQQNRYQAISELARRDMLHQAKREKRKIEHDA